MGCDYDYLICIDLSGYVVRPPTHLPSFRPRMHTGTNPALAYQQLSTIFKPFYMSNLISEK